MTKKKPRQGRKRESRFELPTETLRAIGAMQREINKRRAAYAEAVAELNRLPAQEARELLGRLVKRYTITTRYMR